MSITMIDGKRFAEMIFYGANRLSQNAKYVDSLNVFPVPDGDTGTNMNLSIQSGAKEVRNNIVPHVGKVGQALSRGLLMGARGNSGVILSQLFRGFAKAIEAKESLDITDFAEALNAGVTTAYKAVMKPVEGTILTVAKDSAKKALEVSKTTTDMTVLMEEVVKEAKASLKRTPELLPVLKEVGVVDSGGQGLVFVYEGFLAQLKGEKVDELTTAEVSMDQLVKQEHHKSVQGFINTEDIVYGYCTEFMVKFKDSKLKNHPFSEEKFRNDLSEYGDSLLVIADDQLAKVHIHTEQPGVVLTYGQQYGDLINLKIENMRQQHTTILENDKVNTVQEQQKQPSEYGIVTVSMGSGIRDLFKSIGAEVVIEGGQTMNPSIEDIVKAIEQVNAEKVFILPNNKNIILAAEQARDVCDKQVIVIPSKTVPQGLAALLAFNPSVDAEKNEKAMNDALKTVKSGQITFAIRDTMIDNLTIKKDDYMGIEEGSIVVSNRDLNVTAKELLNKMLDEDSEILTIIRGEEATEEQTKAIVQFVEEKFPEVEIEIHDGKQPLYQFIFSVE
ncbi:DAK2 domain-containing protein [Caldibacillus thermoamylovorans]|uniref:DAK2 domain-containing protein n=1 Tax=Caldibacillus thermoamylovorans TaxID=35841 RepID=UPI001D0899E4|nr:DAK2 domain-containing protein [Caldibacillus thermoamylovorans]MCB5933992.1 DAK2 domain-containing protein [Bacillus sp. DFI.2.34]MCB7075308.1 DAK2 domain-containing protein [Caldibacillus thermoamylovorans]